VRFQRLWHTDEDEIALTKLRDALESLPPADTHHVVLRILYYNYEEPCGLEIGFWRENTAAENQEIADRLLREKREAEERKARNIRNRQISADLLAGRKHDWSKVDPSYFDGEGYLVEHSPDALERHAALPEWNDPPKYWRESDRRDG
jgi:hypothetical protein